MFLWIASKLAQMMPYAAKMKLHRTYAVQLNNF